MAIAGVDPGKDGGVVVIGGPSFAPELSLHVTPTLGSGKREYDLQGMREILCAHTIEHVWIERQQAMGFSVRGRTQGVSTSFAVGEGFGLWKGLLAGLRIPFEIVSPPVWQKAMFTGVPGSDSKAKAALLAQRLHPTIDWRRTARCKSPHEGLCDAFGIAEYGRRELAKRTGAVA